MAKEVRRDFMDYDPELTYQEVGRTVTPDLKDYSTLNDEYKYNAFSRKVVSKPAEDATRNGFRIVIPGDSKKQAVYQKALDKLNLKRVLSQQLIYQSLHGDGYISLGIKETNPTNSRVPLDVFNIENVSFVHAFGQTHVQKYQMGDDPTKDSFQKEQALVVNPTSGGTTFDKNGLAITKPVEDTTVVIDKSRYFHISLDKMEDDYTGTSILIRCADQLKALDTALMSTGKIFRDIYFKVIKSDALTQESDEEFDRDTARIRRTTNTGNTIFIGQDESLEKLTTNIGGINNIIDFSWQSLAAACNIPKSVLTGEQAGTLAGATQDVANYYDGVKAMQEEVLRPELEYIAKLLFYSKEVGDGYEDPTTFEWSIVFNPLWSADDKTKSETQLNLANVGQILVSNGIATPDEAREMLAGHSNGMSGISLKADSLDNEDQLVDKLEDIIHEK